MRSLRPPLTRDSLHSRTVLRLLVATVLLSAATLARAAPTTAPAAGAKADAPPVVVVAVKSLDALDAFARDAGLTLPPYLTPQGIEEKLPFITPGGLARDKPIGVAMAGTADFQAEKNWALVLPLRPRVATIETFRNAGGEPVPGHPDTVVLGAGTFRRTPDGLVFGALPNVVAGLKPDVTADPVKGPNALARVVIDLKAMRRTMPDAFKGFFDQLEKQSGEGDPSKLAGARLVTVPLRDKLDRIELGVDRSAGGAGGGAGTVHVLATFQPVAVPRAGKFNRPGLPADIVARFDLSVPAAEAFPVINKDLLRQALQPGSGDQKNQKKLTPAQQRELADFVTRAADLFVGGGATTVGVGLAGGTPVVYAVNQYTKDIDFASGLKGLVDDVRRYDANEPAADREDVSVETYAAADGSKVTRVRMKGAKLGAAPVYLDAVQKGRTVLLAAGPSETHAAMDRLLAAGAKPEGEMKAAAEGWIDLAAVATAAGQKDAAAALKGQRLTWTAGSSAAGGVGAEGLTIDVTIPPALIAALARMAAPADAAKPATPRGGGL